jgi:RNA polymerase sigma factor (sigma-70 family)
MASGQLPNVVGFLRSLTEQGPLADLSDGQLLDRFLDGADELAFATLLRRHGPLVLSICRRVLPLAADAEDAFQATFLIFIRKARGIAKRTSVACWLHGVAHRVAVRAKKDAARRRARERQAQRQSPPDAFREVVLQDLRALLDEEVLKLPEAYRVPFVLCYLQGRTNEECARLLGCPTGTVQSRLARAREILRGRLARRGLTLSAGLVTGMLAGGAQATVVPGALVRTALRAALAAASDPNAYVAVVSSPVATLTQGVLKTMFLTRLAIVTALLLVVAAAGLTMTVGPFCAQAGTSGEERPERAAGTGPEGQGAAPQRGPDLALAFEPRTSDDPEKQPDRGKEADPKRDMDQERIQGTWNIVACEVNGAKQKLAFKSYQWTFRGTESATSWVRDDDTAGGGKNQYRLEPTKKPKELTISGTNMMLRAIYKLEGDTLTISYFGKPERLRPRNFVAADAGGGGLPVIVWVLKRQKK